MTDRQNLEAVDRTFNDSMRSTLPFSGKVFLYLRYFRQILLVMRAGNRSHILNECFRQTTLYPLFKKLQLRRYIPLLALYQGEITNEDA